MKTLCSPINAEFNRIIKEADTIYTKYAAASGISSTALKLLYSVYTQETPCTQTRLSEDWDLPKQTVNSCLKSLQNEGMLQMVFGEGNRKSKHILLTEQGEALAQRIIDPLIHAENAALQALTPEEQQLYIKISRKHNSLLQRFLTKPTT